MRGLVFLLLILALVHPAIGQNCSPGGGDPCAGCDGGCTSSPCSCFPEFCLVTDDPDPTKGAPPFDKIDCGAGCTSPIILDLENDGFEFSGPEGAVVFDLLATGNPLLIQWVVPGTDDAFLVYDKNRNGLVDDGSELFGNGMRLALEEDRRAPNGFVALAQYDHPGLNGNDDGFIDRSDAIWQELYLWRDANADGVSEAQEMTRLDSTKVSKLGIIPRESRHRDAHGNWLRYWAWAHTHDRVERRIKMVDVYFAIPEF